ncbi:TPA: restriction endonuclease subunit S [Photobacterium damselae]
MSFDWQVMTLDEIVTHQKGFAFKSKDYIDSGIPVVRVSNFTMDSIDCSDLKYVDQFIAEKNASVQLVENDVVIATVGSWPTNPASVVGKTVCVPKNVNGSLLNQNAVRLRVKNNDDSDQSFLYYLLKNKDFSDYIVSTAQGSANQASITLKDIYGYEFAYPEQQHRKKIASYLTSIDRKISLNTQTNQTLEQMAQAIFKSWFVDFDPVKAKMNGVQPEGMDATTASLFPEKLVESELGLIPEGWEVEPLKNVSRVINGRAYKNTEFKEEGTPIIRIQNLTGKGKTVYSDLDLPEDKLVEHGDLIFAWSATFGPHLWRGPKSIYHYHIWKMDVNEKRFGKYLLFMHLARLTDYLKNQGTGSIFTHLTKVIMESQKLVVPSEPIVEAFSKVVTPLFAQIDSLHKENQVLEKLRDTLLPKLLSGEIELGISEELVEAI